MSVFSILGKIVLSLIIVGVVIGGGIVYLLYTYLNPEINKLASLDEINTQLEQIGEGKLSYNPLTGAISRTWINVLIAGFYIITKNI